jgi:hypothetical protein
MGAGDLVEVKKFTIILYLFSILYINAAEGFLGNKNAEWIKHGSAGKEELLKSGKTSLAFPGSTQIFTKRIPAEMVLSEDDFKAGTLKLKIRSSGDNVAPKVLFYIKDKDGNWFQSYNEYILKPDAVTTVAIPLDTASQALYPVGHRAAWNGQFRIMACAYGLNVYSDEKGIIDFDIVSAEVEKNTKTPKLQIIDWQMPAEAKRFEVIGGSFNLSREYFNPFNPDIIEVNVRARDTENNETVFPAYYTVAHTRRLDRDRELVEAIGSPYWAYRFTPRKTGKYFLSLEIIDNSGGKPERILSPEKELLVSASDSKGFVKVSSKDPYYFEFSNGEIFFPLGMNIHTPKDRRYEQRMKDDKIFDFGASSYERYFTAMHRNGLNACEIWMASWSMGIEWTSRIRNYYGLGRYNLAHSAQLDLVMESARKNDIYIHLTLDNHGKLSSHCDQEWQHSPYFKGQPYAVADRACIDSTTEFFSNSNAVKFNRMRNRYIAARWGAYPNIFGVELWSEVDLVTNHGDIYENGVSLKWHNDTAEYFKKWSLGKQPVTTHTCGTWRNTLRIEKLFMLPGIDFVVADAYKRREPMVNYLREHIKQVKHLPVKPRLITEFGLVSDEELPLMRADLHSALWGSVFFGFAGAPFNWWHEFIHTRGHYHHFKGLSKFLKGYDPRGKNFTSSEHQVSYYTPANELIKLLSYDYYVDFSKVNFHYEPEIKSAMSRPEKILRAVSFGNGKEEFVWIFKNTFMEKYPSDEEIKIIPEFKKIELEFLKQVPSGVYQFDFFDTISGKLIKSFNMKLSGKRNIIAVPPFKIDVALKINLKALDSE